MRVRLRGGRDDRLDEILAAKLAENPDMTKDELAEEFPALKDILGLARKSVATIVVEHVLEAGAELFHDDAGRAFATFDHAGAWQTWPIRSQAFRLYTRSLYFEQHGQSGPNAQAINDAAAALEARAIFHGEQIPVQLRVGGDDHTIHLDLGDPTWQAITITRRAWTFVPEPPVRFRRAAGMTALPAPDPGGHVDALQPFVNVATDDDWRLLVAWLLAYLDPRGRVIVQHWSSVDTWTLYDAGHDPAWVLKQVFTHPAFVQTALETLEALR